jgi:hypothetical protein
MWIGSIIKGGGQGLALSAANGVRFIKIPPFTINYLT